MLNNAEQYRQEWAAKTGRPTSEVYVPSALREFALELGARVTLEGQVGRVTGFGRVFADIDWSGGARTSERIESIDKFGVLR
jgi:hypothetical protein